MKYGFLVQEGQNPHFWKGVSFLGAYSNISLWPVVQDRSDMSLVSNGYKQTSEKKNILFTT